MRIKPFRFSWFLIIHKILSLFLLSSIVFAQEEQQETVMLYGRLIDCSVGGVKYRVPYTQGTLTGETNSMGEFPYYEGDVVSFYIGDVLIGQTNTKEIVTPVDLVSGATDITNPAVTNICRLLQSLDDDMILDNGIYIQWKQHEALTGKSINFAQDPEAFSDDPTVIELFETLRTEYNFNGRLRTAQEAQLHFRATMTNYERQGYDILSDMEEGFPIGIQGTNGTYHAGPAISCLLGDIDGNSKEEIVVSGLSLGPAFAFRSDGTLAAVFGCRRGVVYPALGHFSTTSAGLDVVFGGFYLGQIEAYDGNGSMLSGWPVNDSNYVAYPPALADVNNDGLDEIFIEEEDGKLHAYQHDGSILPGWPADYLMQFYSGQYFSTPAIGDIDSDGEVEVVSVNGGDVIYAWNVDGTIVNGFPLKIPGDVNAYPVIGDVDGDVNYEIIVGGFNDFDYEDSGLAIIIVSNSGIIKYTIDLSYYRAYYGSAPILADLDKDGIPEIIFMTNCYLFVFKFDGVTFQPFSGWPQRLSKIDEASKGDCSPVVGDIDGDNEQEIVITIQNSGCGDQTSIDEIRAYEITGVLCDKFPKIGMLMEGGTPAISDIDNDGRQELIVRGSDIISSPVIFVYDFKGTNYSKPEWGQYGRDYKHSNLYRKKKKEIDIMSWLPLLLF